MLVRPLLILAVVTLIVVALACDGVHDSGTNADTLATTEARRNVPPPAIGSPSGSPGAGEDLAAVGEQLAAANGCTSCHSIDGSPGAGPTWQGLYGSETALASGETVVADDAYITESIHDPSAKIVEGFQDIMPKTFANMPDDQIAAIIAFIQSLE
jgi:cytochrome c oxidase subunit 2